MRTITCVLDDVSKRPYVVVTLDCGHVVLVRQPARLARRVRCLLCLPGVPS